MYSISKKSTDCSFEPNIKSNKQSKRLIIELQNINDSIFKETTEKVKGSVHIF